MNRDCLFCKIAAGEVPAKIVRQDDEVVAFEDVNPQAPTHVLLIPRNHVPRAIEVGKSLGPALGRIFEVAAEIARERGLEEGYRLVVNNGPGAGQTVFHLHFHLIGGRGMKWPPG
jgi:histidine triad (HIT) family protein